MSGLDIKRLIKKMARNFGWIAVRYEVLGSSSIGLTDTFEFKAGSPLLQQCSDMIIRVVLRQYYGAVIDIRSSSLNKRVDLGFNNMMINKIRAQVLEMADDSIIAANQVAHAANL